MQGTFSDSKSNNWVDSLVRGVRAEGSVAVGLVVRTRPLSADGAANQGPVVLFLDRGVLALQGIVACEKNVYRIISFIQSDKTKFLSFFPPIYRSI